MRADMRYVLALIMSLSMAPATVAAERLEVPYPHGSNVAHAKSFECTELVYAGISGGADKIEGRLQKGGGEFSVKVRKDDMIEINGGFEKLGIDGASELFVVRNTDRMLVAVKYFESRVGDATLHTFTMNKKSGLAVWMVNEPADPLVAEPVGHLTYMGCR